MAKKGVFPIRELLRKTSTGAAAEIIDFGPVEDGWTYVIQLVLARNLTSDWTALEVGMLARGSFYPLEGQRDLEANEYYWLDEEIHLQEGESLRVRFLGTTAGDELEVTIYGYKERVR